MSHPSTDDCTSVSLACPVEETVYGYYPSLGANAFFCAYFATFTIVNLILAFRYQTWVFGTLVILGSLSEFIGYIGRIIMHSNPWSNVGFEMQICCLIFAPVSASFYHSDIPHAQAHGPRRGTPILPLRPVLYPWIFISCDILSLLLQAIGGATAATANTPSGSATGGHIMLAGIVFQVATFTFLYILTAMFIFKLRRGLPSLTAEASTVLFSRDLKIFATAIFVSSLAVYVRCVYRIAELAQGWANEIMRDQTGYIVLDGVMCCIAILAITVCYPGIFFKSMTSQPKMREKALKSEGSETVV
ncbi:Efflux pump [Hyphodiscus hymeniophilus]|uniref:Efflux pump n=1 Tax=Hyphodiscus hymeniophilus TaxID=353542 RepID=A0A9P7AVN0_9HELO|nr:Efflux pump [Hyphodiscus hymeniophilus]